MQNYVILITGFTHPDNLRECLVRGDAYPVRTVAKESEKLLVSKHDERIDTEELTQFVDWRATLHGLPGDFSIACSFVGEVEFHRRTRGSREGYIAAAIEYLEGFTQYRASIHRVSYTDTDLKQLTLPLV